MLNISNILTLLPCYRKRKYSGQREFGIEFFMPTKFNKNNINDYKKFILMEKYENYDNQKIFVDFF